MEIGKKEENDKLLIASDFNAYTRSGNTDVLLTEQFMELDYA